MLMQQRNHQKGATQTASVVGTTHSAHLTAAQQEERLPHSGPPALHSLHKAQQRDVPLLTRIVSCDERDDEEEQIRQHGDNWPVERSEAGMQRIREGSNATEDSSSDSDLRIPASVDALQSQPSKPRTHFGVWNRNEAGVWTR